MRSSMEAFISRRQAAQSRTFSRSGAGSSSSCCSFLWATRAASSWFLMLCTNTDAPMEAVSNLRWRVVSSWASDWLMRL